MGSILIVDMLPVVRAGLRVVLNEIGMATTVHEAHNAQEALKYAASDLELVIVDPAMPGMNPISFVQQLRKQVANVPILFFGDHSAGFFASVAAKLGVNGYLGKLSDEKTIAATIQIVLGGMQCFPRNKGEDPLPEKMQLLTQKEMTVLLLLRQGLRNKDIARKLYLSEKTISAHKQSILMKLGIGAIAQTSGNEPQLGLYDEDSVPRPSGSGGLFLVAAAH